MCCSQPVDTLGVVNDGVMHSYLLACVLNTHFVLYTITPFPLFPFPFHFLFSPLLFLIFFLCLLIFHKYMKFYKFSLSVEYEVLAKTQI